MTETALIGVGGSGTSYGRSRGARERLDAMQGAIARGDEFKSRIADAEGDAVRLADLMAEAISMAREARGLDAVGRDGRAVWSMEELQAAHCMDAARDAYLKARGSNNAE